MNWKAWGVLGCECIGPRRQGSWLAWNSNRGHEDECMHVFLLEAEKAKLDNGSNEGIQGKKDQGQYLSLQPDIMYEYCSHIWRWWLMGKTNGFEENWEPHFVYNEFEVSAEEREV